MHLTTIEPGGAKAEKHYCDRCAAEVGLVKDAAPATTSEVLEAIVAGGKGGGGHSNLVCEHCGVSYVEFRNQGLLGCEHDYDAFKEPLLKLLDRAHDGADHHTGKTPRAHEVARVTQQDLRKLRRQLDEAVAAEDYERAARLRDRLAELEAQ